MVTVVATGIRGVYVTAATQSECRLMQTEEPLGWEPEGDPQLPSPQEAAADTLTESLMMLRKVLLKRMQNWVRQLAEKLWQPSMEAES